MKVSRSDVVETARGYLGTPFRHQGRLKGVALDCAGLVECVARDLGIADVRVDPYLRSPDPAKFRSALRAHLDEIALNDADRGDILSFRFEVEQHLGIISGEKRSAMIHCFSKVGHVVEHSLGRPWTGRIVSAWRYRVEMV